MTKTLEFAYETPQEVKVGDDETTFTLVCKNEGLPVDLTTAKLITVKIGNRSGYLRGQLISIDSLAKLPIGQFNFSFDKDTLANFPTGSYCLEVWVTDAQGTSIYPSGNPLNFIVTTNIENSSGATITTITFDDFVEAMNKAASTIAKGDKGDDGLSAYQVAVINGYKGSQTDWLASLVGETGLTGDKGDPGKDFRIVKTFPSIDTMNGDGFSDGDFTMIASDVNDPDNGKLYVWNGTSFTYIADLSGSQGIKGDTGTVDNAGLISAPAFQSLQTQVNNSAVGTNLLPGTYNILTTVNATGWRTGLPTYYPAESLKANQTYTVSCYLEPAKHDATIYMYAAKGNIRGTTIAAGSKGISTLTMTLAPEDAEAANGVFVSFTNSQTDTSAVSYKGFKLEKGSVATDWSPNPAEILTESDYAKIKAAIVALGGALS